MLKGTAHKYGSNVDTDAIIPARFLNISEADALAKHCMEDMDIDFIKRVKTGDIMVAETNFGCGSSREHAPLAIKACGISAIIAASFARIFFRNAINIGLPLLESPEAVAKTDSGDVIEINLGSGQIKNVTRNLVFQAKPYPDFMMGIINASGLVEYTKMKIAGGR
ncbi:MAG TPA: 3-isopropylmalate dehydratase small subunit [Dehalococcoidia bacterium]|nr:3-isopropylmalate dehydratase small subunit [Dehalococcoidia bacterium]